MFIIYFLQSIFQDTEVSDVSENICHFYCIKCIFVLKGNSFLFCTGDVSAYMYIEKNYVFFSSVIVNPFLIICEKYLNGNILLFMILLPVMLNFENLIFDITYSHATSLGQIIMILY